ncbi:hypothetical protein ABZX93_32630 [Streptomyces sp. NPDC006632]|uniref:hypothetical protein n=1 Tax=unclassified Streptomyces TaxID=2593676 RepID=UPI002E1D4F82
MSDTNPSLPAPTVDEAPGGVLDPTDAAGGVNLVIPAYAAFDAGDQVQLYWDGNSATDPYTVPHGEGDEPITILVPESAIEGTSSGSIPVYYTVTDRAGNVSQPSQSVQVTVDRTDRR